MTTVKALFRGGGVLRAGMHAPPTPARASSMGAQGRALRRRDGEVGDGD
jgi:hypothetical protein